MKRRTFLSVCGGLLGGLAIWRQKTYAVDGPGLSNIKLDQDKFDQQMPQARWEWEVGEWELSNNVFQYELARTWAATTIILASECNDLCGVTGNCNAEMFAGAQPGHLIIETWSTNYTGDGLWYLDVTLREFTGYRRTVTVLDEDGSTHTIPIREAVNFYDIFRGEHAVVSVGGKEVA